MGDVRPILIAGCGIGGLAAALALAKAGGKVLILERHPELREAGAGIQIGPNGVKALRQLGVADRLQSVAGQPDGIRVYDGRTGRKLTRLPLGYWIAARHGAPYWTLHRHDLFQALRAATRSEPAIEIVLGVDVVSAASNTGGVEVVTAAGRRIEGAGLIGADGVFSQIRKAAFGHPPPMFAGKTAARAVVPAAQAAEVFRANEVGIWLSPRAHLVHYPTRGGAEVAFVAVIDEDWQCEEWSAPVERDRLLHGLAGFAPTVRAGIAAIAEWHKWALFRAQPMPAFAKGRVAVLGDAAHPILPFLAQGAVLALEDAVALGQEVRAQGEDLAEAFQRYSTRRVACAHRVAAASAENGRIYHLNGPAAAARDAVLRTVPATWLMARYDWLYGGGQD